MGQGQMGNLNQTGGPALGLVSCSGALRSWRSWGRAAMRAVHARGLGFAICPAVVYVGRRDPAQQRSHCAHSMWPSSAYCSSTPAPPPPTQARSAAQATAAPQAVAAQAPPPEPAAAQAAASTWGTPPKATAPQVAAPQAAAPTEAARKTARKATAGSPTTSETPFGAAPLAQPPCAAVTATAHATSAAAKSYAAGETRVVCHIAGKHDGGKLWRRSAGCLHSGGEAPGWRYVLLPCRLGVECWGQPRFFRYTNPPLLGVCAQM